MGKRMAGSRASERHGWSTVSTLLLAVSVVGAVVGLPGCGSSRAARKESSPKAAAANACQGQFQKKLQDMTADLQKMGDQNYRVEMSEEGGGGGITIYSRTMPRAVRQYLTASHVDTVPEIRLANHRGFYQIRPRPGPDCDLDYRVRFVAP